MATSDALNIALGVVFYANSDAYERMSMYSDIIRHQKT